MIETTDYGGMAAVVGALVVLVNAIGVVVGIIIQGKTKTAVVDAGIVATTAAVAAAKKVEQVSVALQEANSVSEQKLHEIHKAVNGQGEALRKLAYAAGGRDEKAEQAGTQKEGLP